MDSIRTDYRFGPFAFTPAKRQLARDGVPLKLGARAFDVLQALIEQRHRHVAKTELIERVWPRVVVEENNLEVHIWALRKVLGAHAIATIPGRGYRFTLPLDDEPGAASVAEPLRRGELPQRLPALIGRDAELSALQHAVDEHPLVTVIGVGGIGKSLLAQHLAALERDRRPHGVCWIDLAPLTDETRVSATIAGALGVSLGGGDPRRALAAAASSLKLLMVLDNAEHLAAECAATVQALLAGAPGVHIVVTSQLPLELTSERLQRVGPLAVPEPALSPREAMMFGAVALFVDRITALQPRFSLGEADMAATCSLCAKLDGNPLAIELAAARVPLLGVSGLERTLDERLSLLTKGYRDAPTRHQSLRAALEWSFGLLGSDEQCAFRRLAIFAGSFTLDLAQQVVAHAPLDRWRLLAALDVLVDQSLVAVQDSEPARYRLLESPLALAREHLAASTERVELQERHARATLAHFTAVYGEFHAGRQNRERTLDRLAPDLENGRAAVAWAIEHDATLAVAAVTPLTSAFGRLRNAEGRALWPATEKLLRDDMPDEARLAWTLGAAMFHYTDFQNARACELASAAVTLARRVGDRDRLALALGVSAASGEEMPVDARRAAIDEMRTLLSDKSPLLTRINGAQAEFVFTHRVGDLDACEDAGRRWVDLTRVPGYDYDRSVALSNVADLALARGQVAQAVTLGRELEAQLRDSRHVRTLAVARANLTTALLAADELPEARRMAAAGWPMAAPWRFQPYWGASLSLLAALEKRPRASAALQGYAHARMTAAGMVVEANEAKALERARASATAALGESTYDQWFAAGKGWQDDRAGHAAFADVDLRE